MIVQDNNVVKEKKTVENTEKIKSKNVIKESPETLGDKYSFICLSIVSIAFWVAIIFKVLFA